MESSETLNKHKQQEEEQEQEIEEAEDFRQEFKCCVCLDLLYNPVVLGCGHISCFWCVFNSMSHYRESNCPVCRHPYNHFPSICHLLHFILSKLYPDAYKRREKEVKEEEKESGYFFTEVQKPLAGSRPSEESNVQENDACSPPISQSKNAKSCFSGEGESTSLVNSTETVVHHEESIASPTTSSKKVEAIGNVVIQLPCLHGNDLKNGTHKEISVFDLLCAACKNLLFQPVVLNCGHVYCESCISIPADGICRCQICQSMHPNGFPSVCLVLEHFLEEQYPEIYVQRRESSRKQADNQLHVRQLASPSPSKLSDDYSSCWSDHGQKVHFGFGCDYCGMSPIIGERYKCMDCVEKMGFDLCGACYEAPYKFSGRFNQQHKPEHKLEIVQPQELIDIVHYESDEARSESDIVRVRYSSDINHYNSDEDGSEVPEDVGNVPPAPSPQVPEDGSNNLQNGSAAFAMSVDTSLDPDEDSNDSCLQNLAQE